MVRRTNKLSKECTQITQCDLFGSNISACMVSFTSTLQQCHGKVTHTLQTQIMIMGIMACHVSAV